MKNRKECTMTDLGILKERLTRTGSSSPCSDDANKSEAEGVEGSRFTFCRGSREARAPPAVSLSVWLSDKRPPPLHHHHRHPYNLPAARELSRGGGPDLPACIWLTGDWEGALRAHVTINNPC